MKTFISICIILLISFTFLDSCKSFQEIDNSDKEMMKNIVLSLKDTVDFLLIGPADNSEELKRINNLYNKENKLDDTCYFICVIDQKLIGNKFLDFHDTLFFEKDTIILKFKNYFSKKFPFDIIPDNNFLYVRSSDSVDTEVDRHLLKFKNNYNFVLNKLYLSNFRTDKSGKFVSISCLSAYQCIYTFYIYVDKSEYKILKIKKNYFFIQGI